MKYAIISDIHANYPALRTVLDSIRNETVDRIICLGDIVGFHTAPGECIDLVQTNNIACVAGNHDDGVTGNLGRQFFPEECWQAIEWTRPQITSGQMEFLRRLPKLRIVDGLGWIMHGMFENNRRYLVGRLKLAYTSLRMKLARVPITFHGHTHHPSCYQIHGKVVPTHMDKLGTAKSKFLSPQAYYIINPGSVGVPRHNDLRATYVILDTSLNRLDWRRVDYDHADVVAQTLKVFPSHEHLHRVQESIDELDEVDSKRLQEH